MSSCSPGQGNQSSSDTNADRETIEEVQSTPGTETGLTEDTVISSEEIETGNSEETGVSSEDGTVVEIDQNVYSYTDIKLQIDGTRTIYEDLYSGSMNLEIDKITGEINGYLFMGYMEVNSLFHRSE